MTSAKLPATPAATRWERLESLFAAAVELPHAERSASLAASCGEDAALAAEVLALVEADSREDTFIVPPEPAGDSGPRDLLQPGDIIGAYQIEHFVAGGGMGKVYAASRRDQSFEKRVAVKVIKRGMDTDEVLRRFRRERQTLANLEHPHIARLIDGGTTADGRPYLVMEFVEGQPIDQYCRAQRLTIAQRLVLFRKVCLAVDYAHRNLVVHRDIKPANLLVTAEGEPRLLDFGIAKVLEPSGDSGASLITHEGLRRMTPEYASPEQIRGAAVATASDVYSLGVVLYELLTGRRPYEVPTGTFVEVQRVLADTRPLAPSTAVGRADGSAAAEGSTLDIAAEMRESSLRRLRRQLAGDIDNIVLAALRKEPERRYASAGLLAADIDRYLRRLPVSARRDSAAYRLSKFVSRHRALSALAAALVVTAAVGVTGISLNAAEARRQAVRSALAARKAHQINAFAGSMFAAVRPEERGVAVTVRQVLDDAAARVVTDLADFPDARAEVAALLGRGYRGLGDYRTAEAQLRDALALAREAASDDAVLLATIEAELAGVLADIGHVDEAERLFQAAVSRAAGVNPADESAAVKLAAVWEAQAAFAQTLTRFDSAERALRHAQAIHERLGEAGRTSRARVSLALAGLLTAQGHYASANDLYAQTVEGLRELVVEDDPRLAEAYAAYGNFLAVHVDLERGEELLRRSIDIRRGRLGADHPALAESLRLLGNVRLVQGSFDEAEALLTESVQIDRRTGSGHPALAHALNRLGAVAMHQFDYGRATMHHLEALEMFRSSYGGDHPAVARTLADLGIVAMRSHQYESALGYFTEALAIRERVLGPDHPDLIESCKSLGVITAYLGDDEAAERYRRRALDLARASYPPEHRFVLAALSQWAQALLKVERYEEAVQAAEQRLAGLLADPAVEPEEVGLAESLVGQSLLAAGRPCEAIGRLQAGICAVEANPRYARNLDLITPLLEQAESQCGPGDAPATGD